MLLSKAWVIASSEAQWSKWPEGLLFHLGLFVMNSFPRYCPDHWRSLLTLCIRYSRASCLMDAFVKGFPATLWKPEVFPVVPSFSLSVSKHPVARILCLFAHFLSTPDMQQPFSAWKGSVFKTFCFLCFCWKSIGMGKSCVYFCV